MTTNLFSGVGEQPTLFEDEAVPASGYRGPNVCKIVGITYRQLDYWARTDLVMPSVQEAKGSGTQRLYGFDDIVQLRVVKKLLDTGVSLQRVRTAVEDLRRRGSDITGQTLVSDGATVYAVDDQQAVIDLLRRGQSVFAIALGPVVEELRGEVRAFPSEPMQTETMATVTSILTASSA
ncbi:MAG: DNA-binding transcriptional MerR regulator [Glaciecola sp.]|jgi:DNA-binding transcriptional MerR regulator